MPLRSECSWRAHLVYETGKLESFEIAPPSNVDMRAGGVLCAGHRAEKETIVWLAVQVNVHRASISVVDPRHVIPGAGNQWSRSITCRQLPSLVRDFEPYRAWPSVNRSIQLVAGDHG